jgi:hypothetical protein
MKQKKTFIVLGAIGFVFLLFWFAILALVIKNLLGSNNNIEETPVANVTLCDEDASGLCIVSFGANNLNRMIINFQLPEADFSPFYVKASNRGTVSVYSCEVAELVTTSAYCTGIRTPLGETIELEVYTTDGDRLIARGTFVVSAIALATPISVPENTPSGDETPTPFPAPTRRVSPTPSETAEDIITPTQTASTNTPVSTPDVAYP